MSAGTLKLTNGSTAVTGTGTNFTTDLTTADFVVVTVGGTTHSLAVDSVTNATALVLSAPFTGPTTAVVAWQAVPRKTMLRVTAELNKQVTEALRVANEDAINWQAVLSSPDTVNVLLPDGTTLTGFSWRKINDLLTVLDPDDLSATAAQINTDAQQVATDKPIIIQAKTDAETAKTASETAQGKAETAQQKSEAAQGKSETAQAAAELAATNAAHDASQVNPKNLLHVDQHLSDLTNIPEARATLEVFSKAEIADLLPGYLGQVGWQDMRGNLEPGTAPRDGQQVAQTGIFADLYAKGVAGKLPTCTESEWQADPLKRGCYVLDSAPGMMRLPDDNGVQPGSLRIPVKVGDGGTAAPGSMGGSALPNIKGMIKRLSATLAPLVNDVAVVDGAFSIGEHEADVTPPTQVPGVATAATGRPLIFSAHDSNRIYDDNAQEIQPNRQVGCWTVRYAAKATNGGSIDALALATQIAAGDADLLAKVIATNARLDYAMLDLGTMTLSQRKVMANPFGVNQPVEVVAEIQRTDLSSLPQPRWGETGWIYANGGYGVKASYMEGEGIVVQCGNLSMGNTSTQTGSPHQITSTTGVNNLPVRVHVRKITA